MRNAGEYPIHKIQNFLLEIDNESKSEQEIEKVLKATFLKIDKEIQSDKDKLTEGLTLVIAGTALALPELLKIIGKVTKSLSKFFGGTGVTSEKIIKVADKMHHILVAIIEKSLKFLGMKNPKAISKTADILLHIIIASLLLTSGLGAFKAVKASKLSLAALEGALSAVKGGEVGRFITKNIPEFITPK
jgi:hypothetical protein